MNETSTVATATTPGSGRGTTATMPESTPSVGERAGTVASNAADQAREVADRARSEAGEVARRAGDQVRATAEDQTRRIAELLDGTASELRPMAERGDRPDGTVASMARDGADRLEDLARSLQERGLDGVVAEVQRSARRRPGAFLAGCFAAGLVVGRFVRNDQGGVVRELPSDPPGGATDLRSTPDPWAPGAVGEDPVTAWASTGATAGETGR